MSNSASHFGGRNGFTGGAISPPRYIVKKGTEEHSNKTELSKYIWTLKDNKKDFNINWKILKHAISYTGGSKRCNLCLEEKFCILKENQNCLLNKRMEIISTCRHRKKFRVNNANNTLPHFD
jgi:hypothetical protein